MDPNATLREALEAALRIRKGQYFVFDPEVLADAIFALDEWLRKGGFLPREWQGKASKAKGGTA